MKSNKITFEMLDGYVKSKLDEKLDVRLVSCFDDIPQVKTEQDANNYIIMSDDIITTSSGDKVNRKGYIYSAYKTGDSYVFTGIQEKIEFYPYDILNNNPFALKNHTHKPEETDAINWKDIQNTPDEYMPKEHMHDWEDVFNKPNTYPPSEHTHDDINTTSTWEDISNKPETFPPSAHTHNISDIENITTANSNTKNMCYNPTFRVRQRLVASPWDFNNPKTSFNMSGISPTLYFDRWYFSASCTDLESTNISFLDKGFTFRPKFNPFNTYQPEDMIYNIGQFDMEQRFSPKDLGYNDNLKGEEIPITISLGSNMENSTALFHCVEVYQNDVLVGNINENKGNITSSFTITDDNINQYITIKFTFHFTNEHLWDEFKNTREIEIYYVKIESGTTATPFIADSYEDELKECEKFYQLVQIPYSPIVTNRFGKFEILLHLNTMMNKTPTIRTLSNIVLHNLADPTKTVLAMSSNSNMSNDYNIKLDNQKYLSINNAEKNTTLSTENNQLYFITNSADPLEALKGKALISLEAEYE